MGNAMYEAQDLSVQNSKTSAVLIQALVEYISRTSTASMPEPEIERLTRHRNAVLSWHDLLFTDELQSEAERLADMLQENTGGDADETIEGERVSSAWSAYLFALFEADLVRTVTRTALAARMGYECVLSFGSLTGNEHSPHGVTKKIFDGWAPLLKDLIGRTNPQTGRTYRRFMVTNEFHVYYFDELDIAIR